MPDTITGKKLDLSKLTDEEAKHVWKVVQRDFDLRKKEEDRLGELKTKIEKEDIKRELLGNQTSLTASHCIRCLQAFKFLVNIKYQCLDCQLYICKSCSHYSKKDHGWVCDPCHMARVLKIGTLEWYHENVRARFKRFGSAKVMRSLFKRISGDHVENCREYDTQSMPEVHTDGYEDHFIDAADAQQCKAMKRMKRRLTVDPFDFVGGYENSSNSREEANQKKGGLDITAVDPHARESVLAESDIFQQIEMPCKSLETEVASQHDEFVYADNRTIPSRSMSRLSYSSCGSCSTVGPRGCSSYLQGLDDSEAEDDHCQQYPIYQPHPGRCSQTSLESLNSTIPPSQVSDISDLNTRMSAIESLLSRLEQKVTSTKDTAPTPHSTSPHSQWEEVDLEELQLREKLHRMTDNISDHSLSSDEEENYRPQSCQEIPAWRSPQGDPRPSRIPTRPTSSTSVVSSRFEDEVPQQFESQKIYNSSDSLERKARPLQETMVASFKGSTALLVELEDKVAQAAASVQSAQSEVSYIEDRIAALNVAGTPVDKRKKSATHIQTRRLSHNFPTRASNDAGLMKRRLSVM